MKQRLEKYGSIPILQTRQSQDGYDCENEAISKWLPAFFLKQKEVKAGLLPLRRLFPSKKMADFTIPNTTPVVELECRKAFEALEEREKKYAHYLSRAAYEGSLIVLIQTSSESAPIIMLLQKLFAEQEIESLKKAAQEMDKRITDEDFKALLAYAAAVYSNMGNYKSFGDTKIIPAISKEKLKMIVWESEAFKKHPVLMEPLWGACVNAMYNVQPQFQELGIWDKGISTYYSSNCTKQDVELVGEYMQEKDISPYNTRLFKTVSKDGKVTYQLRLASAAKSDKPVTCKDGFKDTVAEFLGSHQMKDATLNITRGDYSPILNRVVKNLENAKKYAANDNQKLMLENYIHCFITGSINAHKDGSRYWIKDKGPIVESYIGFIESYRDPYGVRGEFEGFVAMVNKEMSEKFGLLVEKAEDLLKVLPWPAEFEKDKFLRPDFTSLDVLSFAGSGIPAGINIPNYDDIRQKDGFKNVSLGNVLSSYNKDKNITFLEEPDKELYAELRGPSFEVQVGLHELLGHGSGKLFSEEKDGTFNFDKEKVKDLISGGEISSWYKAGETWDSIFSTISSTYEECRAECVGLYLSIPKEILSIFGHVGKQADDIMYINWLNMVRAGLLGLEYYSPTTQTWKQAHMQARYVILQVLLAAGKGFVQIKKTIGGDGKPDLLITLDQSKIETVGKDAIGEFLKKLQNYKSTASYKQGKEMYDSLSKVSSDSPFGNFIELRDIVVARKQPRKMFVQAHTEIKDDKVELQEFDASFEGIIKSFVTRFPYHDSELEQIWNADKAFHFYHVSKPKV
eukprot:Seg4231.1 transcript_id=Seg4231.1/GoldUCD/mRNA.D3Y31 product="Dipeptidyl peptidase 3" protein_id=Seg4231.1/GoldUCD/D3Y31